MDNGQSKPLELKDFSGGITDNYFDGSPNRYQYASNLLISVDKKAVERPGTVPYDPWNYLLPGNPRRVDGLFTYINENHLMVNQGRDIYVIPDTYAGWGSGASGWTAVTGPSGNPALQAGGTYAQTVLGEFNHQMYLTNDSYPIPSRIYRDGSNNYQVRTAGLPRAWSSTTGYTASTLLSKCIANANTIRTAMINHINDAATGVVAGLGATQQHAAIDTTDLALLNAAPASTNLATLLTLVGALNNAYTGHISSASITANHFANTTFSIGTGAATTLTVGPNISLASPGTAPTTLYAAAVMLDDIYQKFYWHMMAVNLHGQSYANVISQMNRYDYTGTISKIGAINYNTATNAFTSSPPLVTPNYQDFIDYVNGLACMFNSHLGGGPGDVVLFNTYAKKQYGWTYFGLDDSGAHIQPDTYSVCTLPLATTIDQAYLTIFWLRNLLTTHLVDATAASFTLSKFSGSAGSTSLTSVQDRNSNSITMAVDSWLYTSSAFFNAPVGFNQVAKILTAGSGTATIDRTLSSLASGAIAQYTPSNFHGNFSAGTAVSGSVALASGSSLTTAVSSFGTDLTTWNGLAQELMYCLFTHMEDGGPHVTTNVPGTDIAGISPTITPGLSNWFVPTISSLAYAFTFYDTWQVELGGSTYEIESNPVFSPSIETVEPYYSGYSIASLNTAFYSATTSNAGRSMAITGIPSVVNDASTNYNTSGIIVRIYRTINGGTTFYLDNTVANGVTTFNDIQNSLSITNATTGAVTYATPPGYNLLNTCEELYTTGGILGNDQPPQCKALYVKDGTALYGNLLVDGEYLPNQILQSTPENPDGAPFDNTDMLEDAVVAISAHRGNFIVFCENSVYRSYNGFNQTGQGALAHEKISERIGCLSAHSVVKTEIGVFFAGTDGFYYTDGYQVIKVSIDRNVAYSASTQTKLQQQRIYGAYDKTTRRIWWSMQSNASSSDVDCNWIFYLDYGIKPSGVFTYAYNDGSLVPPTSNGSSSPSVGNPLNYNYWMPSAVAFFPAGTLVRGDPRGLLFKSDPSATTDPKIDLTAAAYTFTAIPTYYTFTISSGNATASATYSNNGQTFTVFTTATASTILYTQGTGAPSTSGTLTLVSGTGDSTLTFSAVSSQVNSATIPAQQWNTVPIPFNLTTCALDFGTLIQRKYATKANFTGKNVGNVQAQFQAISDNGRVVGNLSAINFTQNPSWGDSTIPWGSTTNPGFDWYYAGDADFWRRLRAGTLRANLRQFALTNVFMGVYRSQDFPPGTWVTVNGTTKVITLVTPVATPSYGTITWPLDVVDYFIALQGDGYVKTWQISAVSGNTITVLDPNSTLTTNATSVPWVIRGYKKNQSLRIDSIGIRFTDGGDKTSAYRYAGDGGENAT